MDKSLSRLTKKKREKTQINKKKRKKQKSQQILQKFKKKTEYYEQLHANKFDNLKKMDNLLDT